MNSRKFIAVVAVLIMALSATVCIVSFDDSQAVKLKDQGTIELDVDKDYKSNQNELAKLGITSSDSWTYVEYGEHKGYKLTLKDVIYETEKETALKVTSTKGNVLYVNCIGESKIVCKGGDKGYAICIDARNDVAGENVMICFIGNGVFTAQCDNDKAYNSIAIYASMLSVKGCTLNALSSDIVLTETVGSRTFNFTSDAICITKDGGMEILDGAVVNATAGKMTSIVEELPQIASSGLTTFNEGDEISFVMKDSRLNATGGDMEMFATNVAASIGAYLSGAIEITNSVLRCEAGNASIDIDGTMASEALVLNNTFTARNSTIVAFGGDINVGYAPGEHGDIYSVGVKNTVNRNDMTVTNSSIIAYGGDLACEQTVTETFFSAGMINQTKTEFNVKVTGSVILAEGGYETEYSYGFVIMDKNLQIAKQGTLTIDDSEFKATGKMRALAIGNIVCINPQNVKWHGYEKNGEWFVEDPSKLPTITDATSVFIGYNSIVFIKSSEDKPLEIDVETVNGDSYCLPHCKFIPPEGKQFKCWSVDGAEYEPGQSIAMDYPYKVVTAVWEDIPVPAPSSSGNVPIIVCIVAFILVIIALIGVILYERYS